LSRAPSDPGTPLGVPACARVLAELFPNAGAASFFHISLIVATFCAGADPEGGDWGDRHPLKPTKLTFFTMILYNSINSIRNIRPFCRPLFGHSNVVKHISALLQ